MRQRLVSIGLRASAFLVLPCVATACAEPAAPPPAAPTPAVAAPQEPPPPPPAPEPEPEAGSVKLSTAFLVGGEMPTSTRDQITDRVVQAIHDGTPLFRRCYAKALSRDPSVQGELDVELVIKTDGTIGLLRPGETDIADEALVACTLRVFEQLTLPTPPADYSIVAPMQFRPE